MELLETMRSEDGRVELLDRHLERLELAGHALGFAVDAINVRRQLARALAGQFGTLRVRLTVDQDGRVDIGTLPIASVPTIRTVVDVGWPPSAAPERSRFKTTDRLAYDSALQVAWEAGADEAVLVDEERLLVEATRANVWLRMGDDLVTPSLSHCGLPGVMREHILATVPGAQVHDVTVDDLRSADEVLLSNAVRGLFPVRLGTRPAGRA